MNPEKLRTAVLGVAVVIVALSSLPLLASLELIRAPSIETFAVWVQLASTIAVTLATIVLALVTWRYAKSTAEIADATRDAALHAKQSAEAALQQVRLQACPQVRLLHFEPQMKASRDNDALGDRAEEFEFPKRIVLLAINDGPGPANNIAVKLMVAEIEFDIEQSGSTELPTTEESPLEIIASCPIADLPRLARNYSEYRRARLEARTVDSQAGAILISCDDGIPQRLEFSWELWARIDDDQSDSLNLGHKHFRVVELDP